MLNPIGLALLLVLCIIALVGGYNYAREQYGAALLCGVALAILSVVIGLLQIPL